MKISLFKFLNSIAAVYTYVARLLRGFVEEAQLHKLKA